MSTASTSDVGSLFVCPMHGHVRQAAPGLCPRCGMELMPQGTRFGLLRHMIRSPHGLAVMVVAMLVIMAGIMMLA